MIHGMSELYLEPLEKALAQLKSGLVSALGAPENDLMRDGVIQRFEYTVDLGWKFLQRHLREIVQIEESTLRTKKDIFREGARLGLIDDAEAWIAFYEARNESSHRYDAARAQAVFEIATRLPAAVERLLEGLRA